VPRIGLLFESRKSLLMSRHAICTGHIAPDHADGVDHGAFLIGELRYNS
jgi:hypothetical protein